MMGGGLWGGAKQGYRPTPRHPVRGVQHSSCCVPHSPSSRARCNILHVAPQTRDLATHGPDRGLPIPDQHRTTEVVPQSIRDDGVERRSDAAEHPG